MAQPSVHDASRDVSLDVAKGLAIILVICGHVSQSRVNFDDYLPFRLIYAFHMPLFMFLSGAVASLGARHAASLRDLAGSVAKAVRRLLVPFAAWTMLAWPYESLSLPAWLGKVFDHVDYSLWFLVAVFHCILMYRVWSFAVAALVSRFKPSRWGRLTSPLQYDLVSLPLSVVVMIALLYRAGDAGGLHLAWAHYPSFILGVLFWRHFRDAIPAWMYLVSLAVFACLVPFWHRTEPGLVEAELTRWIGSGLAKFAFHAVVAYSGTVFVVGVSRYLAKSGPPAIVGFLGYCGVASLAIYAMHGYVLGLPPIVVAPLLACLAGYWVISRLPILPVLLFGEPTARLGKL